MNNLTDKQKTYFYEEVDKFYDIAYELTNNDNKKACILVSDYLWSFMVFNPAYKAIALDLYREFVGYHLQDIA